MLLEAWQALHCLLAAVNRALHLSVTLHVPPVFLQTAGRESCSGAGQTTCGVCGECNDGPGNSSQCKQRPELAGGNGNSFKRKLCFTGKLKRQRLHPLLHVHSCAGWGWAGKNVPGTLVNSWWLILAPCKFLLADGDCPDNKPVCLSRGCGSATRAGLGFCTVRLPGRLSLLHSPLKLRSQ